MFASAETSAHIQATVIVPAYNEEAALPHVLEEILSVVDSSYEVLVVDDGSRDGTRAVAGRYPCRLISHEVNRGKGAAMRTGIQHAQGEKIIFIDGDSTYPATAIPEIVRQLGSYDLVRCVRSDGRDNIPLLNRLGNKLFDGLIKSMHRVEGDDVLSGLYGLHKQHLGKMRLGANGFDIESEIMIKAQAMKLQSHSLPIQYNERIGEKKLSPVRDGIKILMRVFSLAVKYNPFTLYVLPGLALWLLSLIMVFALSRGTLATPLAGLSTHTMIASAMGFLAGFQLVMFGCMVNLYAAETGLGKQSRLLGKILAKFPRLGGAVAGLLLSAAGMIWTAWLVWLWVRSGFSSFHQTEPLVLALSLIIWGFQLISTMLFLSLAVGLRKYMVK
jgi:glycosyltransferase involved in cell wall biosynthesis